MTADFAINAWSYRLNVGAFETSPLSLKSEVSKVTFDPWTAKKSGQSAFGTGPAISRAQVLGVGPELLRQGRGGARNRADRESISLSATQIANLREAVVMSQVIGLPLNRFITVHWQAGGLRLEDMAKATTRFIDHLTKWLTRREHRTAWIWVHENGSDVGGHCHLLAYVPPSCVGDLTARQKRWLQSITGKPYRRKMLRSKPVGPRLGVEVSNPDLYSVNLERVVAYVTKAGAIQDPSLQKAARGRIVGKRCGNSQNIGVKARSLTCQNIRGT